MIKLITHGDYLLIETEHQTKVLVLNEKGAYAWIMAGVAVVMLTSQKEGKNDSTLSLGKYRLYKVFKEDDFTDGCHLELSLMGGLWQGYYLPQGLPTNKEQKNCISTTREIITKVRTSVLHSLSE